MTFKRILFAFVLIVLALFVITNISAADNDTVTNNNTVVGVDDSSNLQFEQSYNPPTVTKGNILEVYLAVKNIGSETYNNLTILYPLPKGLEVLIHPSEYKDNSVWTIDSLYPNETNTLTLVCVPTVSNVTFEFTASVDGGNVSTMDIYCQPSKNPDVGPGNGSGGMVDAIGSVSSNGSLKDAGNPIFLLLFTLIFIPYIRIKY